LLASSSHGFARSRVDDNARVEFHPAAPERRVPESPLAHRVAREGRATVPHVPIEAQLCVASDTTPRHRHPGPGYDRVPLL
jgi:hypothetical protein